jgi:hypothetical protein
MAILYLILQIKRDEGSATEWIRAGILCEILSEFGVRSGVTFVAFKASSEDPASLDRRLISKKPRQASGPTSDLVPDTDVGVVLRGIGSHRPSSTARNPQTPDLLHLALRFGMATDLDVSILAFFNGHPASDMRQWFRTSTRHAHCRQRSQPPRLRQTPRLVHFIQNL